MAAEIADKLCASVAAKLDGKTVGTFSGEQKMVLPFQLVLELGSASHAQQVCGIYEYFPAKNYIVWLFGTAYVVVGR